MFLNIKESEFGIHALTNRKNDIIEAVSSETIIEKASLEDIMFYMKK